MSVDLDRIMGALESFVRGLFPNIDYLALYPARVAAQNGDGTLELVPDDPRLPGLSSVPVRYGTPDTTAVVASGARVLLGFAGGDPSKPIATVWESASITSITIGASGPTQPAALGQDVRTELDAIWNILSTHVHAGVTTGSGASGVAAVTPVKQTVKSATVKVKT